MYSYIAIASYYIYSYVYSSKYSYVFNYALI